MNISRLDHDESIRKNLLIAKSLFFVGYMGGVGWSRFQNAFYLEHGMNASQIGILKSVGLVLKMIGEPFWCAVADVTGAHKVLFVICILMQISTLELLRWIPLNFFTLLVIKAPPPQAKAPNMRCWP